MIGITILTAICIPWCKVTCNAHSKIEHFLKKFSLKDFWEWCDGRGIVIFLTAATSQNSPSLTVFLLLVYWRHGLHTNKHISMIVCEVFPCSQRQEQTRGRSTGHRRTEGNRCTQAQGQLKAHVFIEYLDQPARPWGESKQKEVKIQTFRLPLGCILSTFNAKSAVARKSLRTLLDDLDFCINWTQTLATFWSGPNNKHGWVELKLHRKGDGVVCCCSPFTLRPGSGLLKLILLNLYASIPWWCSPVLFSWRRFSF